MVQTRVSNASTASSPALEKSVLTSKLERRNSTTELSIVTVSPKRQGFKNFARV